MGRLFAASFAVIVALLALIFAIGTLVILKLNLTPGLTMAVASGFALVVVLVQYAVAPALIDWIVKTRWANPMELGQDFDSWLRQTCSTFQIPTPRLGIIEEAAPNAFTYGHGPGDARVVITRGLIQTLTPDELKAVVAHELGHIKHRDFIVMTIVQGLVLVMYALYIASRSRNNSQAGYIVIFSYLAYLAAYYISLLLSRIREYMADFASAQIMQNGNDLSSALVKISYGLAKTQSNKQGQTVTQTQQAPPPVQGSSPAYGMSTQASAAHRADEIMAMYTQPKPAYAGPSPQPKPEKEKPKKESFSVSQLGAFGIAGTSSVRGAVAWFDASEQPDPKNFIIAARWELYNPWAKIAELCSTHPLTALRIKALQKLNKIWNVPDQFDFSQIKPAKYKHFARDIFVVVLPFVGAGIGVGLTTLVGHTGPLQLAGAAGVGFFLAEVVKLMCCYPGGFNPSKAIRLRGDVDVSHVKAIPVAIEGVFTSRISPGIAWASDFILQDETAFIACLYKQPLGIFQFLWGWLKAESYVGRQVRVYGWYRRFGAPYIEISRFEVVGTGEKVRCYLLPFNITLSLIAAMGSAFLMSVKL